MCEFLVRCESALLSPILASGLQYTSVGQRPSFSSPGDASHVGGAFTAQRLRDPLIVLQIEGKAKSPDRQGRHSDRFSYP